MSAALDLSLLSGLVTPELEDSVAPPAPETMEELGVAASLLEQIILKLLMSRGEMMGRDLATALGVRFSIIDPVLETLKRQHLASVKRSLGLGAVTAVFELSESGRAQAREHMETNQYMGAVPVPMEQYVQQVAKQKRKTGWLTPEKLTNAYRRMVVTQRILSQIGPAVASGKSLLIYGQPGNGKTFLAEALVNLDEDVVYVPAAVICQGNIIRVFDPVQHRRVEDDQPVTALSAGPGYDGRWIRCRRPFLISGGELTMGMLDLSFNPTSKVYEAPFHMKANNGIYMIDDFGRQGVSTAEVLNRWIVPMEQRMDYLTFLSGGKMVVPFETFLIFSTNLKPEQLGDEAFLRRIQYKMLLRSPERDEFTEIFDRYCGERDLPYEREMLEHFLGRHYGPGGKAFRRCHPRDVVSHAIDMIRFEGLEFRLTEELMERAWESCFTEEVE
jgi:predicted ATPase with chaperone activity